MKRYLIVLKMHR